MSSTSERNDKVQQILVSLYQKAIDPTTRVDESPYKDSVDKLFTTDVWGFREVLLVVIVGMYLNPNYKASTGFYGCKPRALYEGPIKEFLLDKNIPHRKSGPLNVAKAAVGLNETWAAQRQPDDVARAIVRLVNYLEADNGSLRDKITSIGISLMRRLINESQALQELAVDIEPSADPDFLFYLCKELITKVPDAGNTPQKIAALLLKNYHLYFHTGIEVTGDEDRASVTSTTSKKPGDINEECAGRIYKVYEVTVKAFDVARIRDSYDCIKIYNDEHGTDINEIIVICRPQDCPSDIIRSGMHGYLGKYEYQNVVYYYWDLFEWAVNLLQHMTPDGRKGFYASLNSYINATNTAEKVKRLWLELHTQ